VVVNLKKLDTREYRDFTEWNRQTDHLYIGRSCVGSNNIGSKWENPFKVSDTSSRELVVSQYKEHLENSPELQSALFELRGKILGCWCKPDKCHGDILVEAYKHKVNALPSVIEDRNGSLFDAPMNSALAHCVSCDLHMNAGIAKQFSNRWPDIRDGPLEPPGSVYTYNSPEKRVIFNLITKNKYYHKPTYRTLENALLAMKERAIEMQVDYISIPEIGSGLDLLDPNEVREIINFVFRSKEIRIVMYHLYGEDRKAVEKKLEKKALEGAIKTTEKRTNSLENETKETVKPSIPSLPAETSRPSIPGLPPSAESSKNKKKKNKKKKAD